MDCCKYGEYRAGAHAAYGAGAGWDGYYAPLPYAPYAHAYYAPHAHDPYARYYRYDYPAHHPHTEHVLPMDYGGYASKEARVRRALSRRERPLLSQHPHPPTPPLECGISGRSTYCEPQMWTHYQMGVLGGGGWNSANPSGGSWAARGSCSREHLRYPSDFRPVKASQIHAQNQACLQDGRSTPYRAYDDSSYNGEGGGRHGTTSEFPVGVSTAEPARASRERLHPEPRRTPPEEKWPPVVPLPAFQQAFGSTEIGKFAEAFSRAEVALDEIATENFGYESFSDWEAPQEPQWSSQPASREIKCEDTY